MVYLNIGMRWQVCWTPPVKLEADLALVELKKTEGVATMVNTLSSPLLAPTCQLPIL